MAEIKYEEFIRCGKLVRRKPRWANGKEVSDLGYKRCTAQKTHGKGRCRQPSVRGKDKCKWHGGATSVKEGLYSKYLTDTLGSAIVDAGNDALGEEVRLSRAILTRSLGLLDEAKEKMAGKPLTELSLLNLVRGQLDQVRQTVESHSKIIERRSITPDQIELVVRGLMGVLSRHVGNEVLKVVAREMKEVPWPAGVSISLRGAEPRELTVPSTSSS